MTKIALVFPGQGSQVIGMGLNIFERYSAAREVFEEADNALNEKLSQLIFYGQAEELKKTSTAQPAILTMSTALLKVFQNTQNFDNFNICCAAGHSLGEFSAYVASGVFNFSDAVKLVRKRGQLMESVPVCGKMAAVLGIKLSELEEICRKISDTKNIVEVANINCEGQIVISGTIDGVNIASEHAKTAGAKRVIPLEVSGPFHSSLMAEASKRFAKILAEKEIINTGKFSVYTNLTGLPVNDIVNSLTKQIVSAVKWQKTIENMIADGVNTFIEVGEGKVLSGIIKKINCDVTIKSVYEYI